MDRSSGCGTPGPAESGLNVRADKIGPMREGEGGLTVRQRAMPRVPKEALRPVLRCAVVIETLPLFAEGLVRLLRELADVGMISTAPTAAGLRTLLARLRPDLVVLDLEARDTRPLDAARLVRRHAGGAKLIFLAASFSPQTVPTLLRAGASAVLLKSARPADMRDSFARVLRDRDAARKSASGTP
jgi:two-component system nitrate/nitrite response regulator NarL